MTSEALADSSSRATIISNYSTKLTLLSHIIPKNNSLGNFDPFETVMINCSKQS